MPRPPRASVSRSSWLTATLWLTACTPAASPELNPSPAHAISIVGTVPPGLAIEFTTVWQTTVVNDACAPRMPAPVGVRSRRIARLAVDLKSRAGNQAAWETSWDRVVPGECGWQLAAIEFKADRSAAAFAAHAATNLGGRIAFVCPETCVANSQRMNDDASQVVTQYCRFSLLGTGGVGLNPCVYGSDGRFAGANTPPFKEQHILRPGQQLVRFVLVDLDSPRT